MRATALLIGAALTLIALGARAEAQPSEAERLYTKGQEAYDERHYDVALALWQRSYGLSKLPALLFNLAQAYRLRGEAGDCARAAESYRRFIELDPGSARRATAEALLDELEECAKASPGSPDQSDEEPPARVQPAADPEAAAQDPGGSVRSAPDTGSIRSTTRDLGAPKRSAGMIVASGGAVAAVVGLYFGDRARRLADEVSEACAGGCHWGGVAARDAEGRSAERTQWILYGVGAGGLIAGAALYYLGTRGRPPAVAVTPRGGGGLLTWSGRW
jgi:tetratricopeptide (TPR) repeat protein